MIWEKSGTSGRGVTVGAGVDVGAAVEGIRGAKEGQEKGRGRGEAEKEGLPGPFQIILAPLSLLDVYPLAYPCAFVVFI